MRLREILCRYGRVFEGEGLLRPAHRRRAVAAAEATRLIDR
jgi:hypothetical protein